MEEVARQNRQTVETNMMTMDKIDERVDALMTQINYTSANQEIIVDKLKDLGMQSSPENIGLIAYVVNAFADIERDLNEIGEDWVKGNFKSI